MERPVVRTSVALALVISATACDYSADLMDCRVACSPTSLDCPSGFTCQMSEGLCRPPGTPPACMSILGDAAIVDSWSVDAAADGAVLPDAGTGAPKLVQQAVNSTSSGTMVIVTLPSAINAGDLLVMTASTDTMINNLTVAGGGVTWQQVTLVHGISGNSIRASMWYGLNATNGGTTAVTVTVDASDDFAVSVSEWSGILASGALDTSATAGPATTITVASGNATTTHTNDLLVAMGAWDKSGLSSGPSGFTPLVQVLNPGAANLTPAFKIAASADTYSTTWTLTATTAEHAGIITGFRSQ